MCACLFSCILTSSFPQVHILRFMCACLYPCILTSHPLILSFMCPCLYTCILTSSYPQFRQPCWYPRILTSSYPQVYLYLLVCSHPQVNVFLIRMNNCILASLSSLVASNRASEFVNNLQILGKGQAFVLDFYGTSRKIYWKQPLRADLEKKLLLKSRQNL